MTTFCKNWLFLFAFLTGFLRPVSSWAVEQGPSFDCATAQSAAEKVICKDSQLAVYDRRLTDIYQSLLSILPDEQKGKLRDAQRLWLKERNERCTPHGSPTDSLECMNVYQERIEELKKQFPAGWEERANYRSPDKAFNAVTVQQYSQDCLEIYDAKGKLVYKDSSLHPDDEHGMGIGSGVWSTDSRYFIYSIDHLGGHSPMACPETRFYDRQTYGCTK